MAYHHSNHKSFARSLSVPGWQRLKDAGLGDFGTDSEVILSAPPVFTQPFLRWEKIWKFEYRYIFAYIIYIYIYTCMCNMFAIIFAGVLLRVLKKDMVRPPFRVLIIDVISNTSIN